LLPEGRAHHQGDLGLHASLAHPVEARQHPVVEPRHLAPPIVEGRGAVEAEDDVGDAGLRQRGQQVPIVPVADTGGLEIPGAEEPSAGDHGGRGPLVAPDVIDHPEPPGPVEDHLSADEIEAPDAQRNDPIDGLREALRSRLRRRSDVAVTAVVAVEVAHRRVLEDQPLDVLQGVPPVA
jgi:hypothetical protein